MYSPILQLLVLAGIAIFLILRLRGVLGTREGFEKPPVPQDKSKRVGRPDFEVIEGGPDHDIVDHVPEGSPSAQALSAMKAAEPSFSLGEFLQGARGAYEMILMAFENGDLEEVRAFLSEDVHAAFAEVVAEREAQGLSVDSSIAGIREVSVREATFDESSREGEIAIRFVAEMTTVVRNAEGEVVEGSASEIRTQSDVWTFARTMGNDDPNWLLVATGE
ncbi:Tim44/TimA family putative adaptor protein [Pseudoroseicyclus aestuarii]|uniref:Putative lipid-binding transport protein (Tim44 family) n=1 Tax=Pseudoroseicyclus aestuarii TaxID=1795041 RepID=A0A318SRY2_9RHOB|nr:Tim44/TimA family putative adaptor protein [Pseudoroseicyclus aestuarii]PYE84453.1 putative lipid-binding transport protein (Tim44 family) [Pseudoroseicyclus aestuarii]